MKLRLPFILLSTLVACSSPSSGGGGSDSGADGTSDSTPSETSTDAPADGDGGVCWDDAGNWLFDYKNCGSDADCTTAPHTTDCCGSQTIVGVAKSKLTDFKACESSWDSHFPGCGCAPAPTQTEDHKMIADATKAIVKCTNFTSSGGVCMTSAP